MKHLRNIFLFIQKLIQQHWITLTYLMLGSITLLSLLPAEQIPRVAGGDKTHHIVAYTFLMLPTAFRKPKYWPLIAVSFLCWGTLIEFIQPFTNRYFEVMDIIANGFGILLAIIMVWLSEHLLKIPTQKL